MEATVDITKQDGKMLADAPRANAITQTAVYASLDAGADAEVHRIVAANAGHAAAAVAKTADKAKVSSSDSTATAAPTLAAQAE